MRSNPSPTRGAWRVNAKQYALAESPAPTPAWHVRFNMESQPSEWTFDTLVEAYKFATLMIVESDVRKPKVFFK